MCIISLVISFVIIIKYKKFFWQNVISIQQLMDQMSVQVMNTQLQLQQSLQQLIAMGTQSNQSELSVPAVNQSQLIFSANQQHRGVIVNNQQENLQVLFLIIFLFGCKTLRTKNIFTKEITELVQ